MRLKSSVYKITLSITVWSVELEHIIVNNLAHDRLTVSLGLEAYATGTPSYVSTSDPLTYKDGM